MFQNIHDSYDELKSSTLMSPKLLAMCGIVKRSYGGEFESNIADSELHNLGAWAQQHLCQLTHPTKPFQCIWEWWFHALKETGF